MEYDFEIQYKPGKENTAVDALSRSFVAAWSCPKLEWFNTLKCKIEADNELKELWENCEKGSPKDLNYYIHNGVLLWRNRLVAPKGSSLMQVILHEYHDAMIGVLKRFRNNDMYLPLPLQTSAKGPILEHSRVLGFCIILKHGKPEKQVHVQWRIGDTAEIS
ncbi:uncharacterized protein [Arachis hypogaea]|uniref:uncharacterized protein n=1 Tax=Arachis hypogaea TaxID=3818 RepID=UPI003B2125D9